MNNGFCEFSQDELESISAGGIACMASSTVTVPMAVGGYALYNLGGLVMIGSMVD